MRNDQSSILKTMPRAIFTLILVFSFCVPARAALESTPGAVVGVSEFEDQVYVEYENFVLDVKVLENGIVKLFFTGGNINGIFLSPMITDDAPNWVAFDYNSQSMTINCDSAVVKFNPDGFGIDISSPSGAHLVSITDFSWAADGAYEIKFDTGKDNRIVGSGEPLPPDIYGDVSYLPKGTVPIWNRHDPPSEMGMPYIYSLGGVGLFIDNPWRAEWDFTKRGETMYRASGGPFEIFVIPGDIKHSLEGLMDVTGHPPIPPRWVTGYMQSRYGYENEEDFRTLMDEFRTRKIPCDALIVDLDWFGRYNMGNLWWLEDNFPNGSAILDEMEQRGFKSILITEPYVFKQSYNYEELREKELFTFLDDGTQQEFPFWGGKPAGLLDFSNGNTRAWYAEKAARLKDAGNDGWWTDLNEPEKDPEGSNYLTGPRDGVHNLLAFYMNMALAELYSEKYPDDRLFIMTRSGINGIQRFGSGVWSGDVDATFNHLEAQVPIALATGMSGMPMWNSDIGGFHGKPTEELFVRWMQFGAFCPVFRAHGNHSEREPWAYGQRAEDIITKYINLRYSLTPYLYTLFHEMHETGTPIMRPTLMEFPSDPDAIDRQEQFMYGADFLVAPVTEPSAKKKKVYLPEGGWTYFWDERKISGPRNVTVPVDLETMPLFVRDGAIIPMAPVMQYTSEKPVDPLTIHYYPSEVETIYELYEDDGKTTAYMSGYFAVTTITAKKSGSSIELSVGAPAGNYEGMPEVRNLEIVIHSCEKPATVSVNGKAASADSYSYNSEKKLLTVKATASKDGVNIRVDS